MSPASPLVHLGKEWREQRATLLVLALVLPAALGPAFVLEPSLFDDPRFAPLCAGLAGLACLLTVAGDLVAGERARGGLAWLELPGGQAWAFRAKLVFLAVATAALLAYGLALGAAAGLVTGQGGAGLGLRPLAWVAAGAAPLVAWSLACGAWVAHGALALPLALLVVGTLGLPYERLLLHADYRPPTGELLLLASAATLAGALVARRSFVHGARPAGPRGLLTRGAAIAGLALLGFAPSWAWTAVRLEDRSSIDPWSPAFRIGGVRLTKDGGQALVDTWEGLDAWDCNKAPHHTLLVDLRTGAWQDLGAETYVVELYEPANGTEWDLRTTELHVVDKTGGLQLAIDARDGRVLEERGGSHIGSRRRSQDDWVPFNAHETGLGWRARDRELGSVFVDPFRDRTYPVDEVLPEPGPYFVDSVLIGPQAWLVEGCAGDATEGPYDVRWFRLDPDTREATPTGWPDDQGFGGAQLADGRLILCLGDGLALGDPDTLELLPLVVDPVLLPANYAYRVGHRTFREDGPVLLQVSGETFLDRHTAIVEPEARTVRALGPDPLVVWGTLDERTVLLGDDEEQDLVALDLVTNERRVLFPREVQP